MSVSMIPWVGGKEKLLWIIDLLAPAHYSRFIDVFGGSGTVILSRPLRPGCMEVYNDINSDLVNLFKCVRDRPLAMLNELGFLPLHSHEEFDVLLKFFDQEEFTNEYLQEEMELAQRFFPPEQSEELCKRMLARAQLGDVRRAAAYFKRIRGSFSGGGKSFAGKPCDIRHFFHLIWECSRRLKDVVIENRDFSPLTFQYDRPDALFYYDPPYYDAERCYEAVFTKEDHIRLHRVARECKGYVMVSYNCCEYIHTMKKRITRILSLVCALALCMGAAVPALAADIATSGGTGSTPVNLTTTNGGLEGGTPTATKMSVTVPTAFPIAMSDDGSVVTATDCKIVNNSYGAVRVKSVSITAGTDWHLTTFSDKATFASEKVDSNKLGFAMTVGGGSQVKTSGNDATQSLISAPTTGCYLSGIGDTTKNTAAITYSALVSPLSTAVTNATVANVVFTIEWDV